MKTNRSLSLRILSVLLCLCMMLGMLPAIAMAEGEFVTIYFENGDGWDMPNAYAWNADEKLLGQWPGTAMTQVEGNTYSIQVPSDAALIVFNDGTNQTVDLSMPTDGNNLYSIATDGWSVYDGEVCDHNYESVVTPPTCTAAGYTTHTCTLCGGSYTADPVAATGHSYGDDTICDNCGDECMVIYFENGDGWGIPNAYAWNADEKLFGPWPGTAMTQVEGNTYSIQVPSDAAYIIFNDGSNQTYDLDLPTDGTNLYTYATESWSIYQGGSGEGGEETSAKITIHMVDCCDDGWDTNAIAVQINGVFQMLVTLEAGAEATYELDYEEGNAYSFFWYKGEYPEECGFEILIDGEEVYAAGIGYCTEYEQGKLLYTNCIHSFGEGIVAPPTCTNKGYTVYTCSICCYNDVRDVVAANGHSFGEDGLCTVCGSARTIVIELTDSYGDGWNGNYIHVYANGVERISLTVEDEEYGAQWGENYDPETLYTVKWEAGSYPDECGIRILIDDVEVWSIENCTHLEDGQIIYANCDHSLDDGVLTPPTCTEDGKTVYTCTLCGYSKVVVEETTGHTPEGEGTVVPPTCTDYGYTEYLCANCGEYYEDEIEDATDHSYGDDHVCDTCGHENLITLYFRNTGNWAQPYAYGWRGIGESLVGDWPGTAMTHLRDDMYSITVPATIENVIFHDNNGTQTDDLPVPTDGNNLFTYGASDWETKKEINLHYPSLSFDEEIRYNIYFTFSGMEEDIENMGLILFDSMLTNGTMDDAIEVIPGVVRGESEYAAHTNGIPAKKLGDTIYFKVYAMQEDGSYVYSNIQSYSAVEYAMDRLANSANEELKRLCVAMLNYGAAAQVYFDYKTDSLMNAGLTEEHQALIEGYRVDMVADIVEAEAEKVGAFAANGGFGIKYPSVSFEGAFAINYIFKTTLPVDADVKLYYWSLDTYYNADELTVENADGWAEMTGKNGFYKAAVEGIYAKNIDQTIFVAGVYESDGETYSTGVLAYSLGAYCTDRAEKGNEPMPALAKATAVYGYYAKQYFGG